MYLSSFPATVEFTLLALAMASSVFLLRVKRAKESPKVNVLHNFHPFSCVEEMYLEDYKSLPKNIYSSFLVFITCNKVFIVK
ncbi:hypothetical protein P8452_24310 [Trifolium repens]|nr:hypothetical protein P8452_24310 [Trifolium repens]